MCNLEPRLSVPDLKPGFEAIAKCVTTLGKWNVNINSDFICSYQFSLLMDQLNLQNPINLIDFTVSDMQHEMQHVILNAVVIPLVSDKLAEGTCSPEVHMV